jgi:hypothetical protein
MSVASMILSESIGLTAMLVITPPPDRPRFAKARCLCSACPQDKEADADSNPTLMQIGDNIFIKLVSVVEVCRRLRLEIGAMFFI